MSKSTMVHFSVEGMFVTDLARNLWAELAVDKAMNILVTGIIGMDEPTAMLICTGRYKLIGTNKMRLVRDKAKTDNRDLPLLPIGEVVSKLQEQIKKEQKTANVFRQEYTSFAEQFGRPIAEKLVVTEIVEVVYDDELGYTLYEEDE